MTAQRRSADTGGGAARNELRARLADWSPDLIGTLLFIIADGRVLLIHKRRGHGAGRINGPGGKLEPGEAPLECAVRETREETGLTALDARLAAVMRFVDIDGADWLGYVFCAGGYEGTLQSCEEAVPVWFDLDALPFEHMWPDDQLWLPRVLADERLAGDFLFRGGELLAWEIGPLRCNG